MYLKVKGSIFESQDEYLKGRDMIMKKVDSRIEKIRKNAKVQGNFDRMMELNSLKVYDLVNRF